MFIDDTDETKMVKNWLLIIGKMLMDYMVEKLEEEKGDKDYVEGVKNWG